MRRLIAGVLVGAGLALTVAACGTHTTSSSTSTPPTSTPVTAPAPTIQSRMVAWWATAQGSFSPIENDLAKVSTAAQTADTATMSAGCTQLVTDVQTLQSNPAPDPTVNTHLQAAMTAYAKAGAECQTGIASNDTSQLDAAVSDITVGNSELAQADGAVKSLVGS